MDKKAELKKRLMVIIPVVILISVALLFLAPHLIGIFLGAFAAGIVIIYFTYYK